MVAYFAADLKAVLPGEHYVEQNEIRLVHFEGGKTLLPVGCGLYLVALFFEVHFENIGDVGIIVNDKDFGQHFKTPFV